MKENNENREETREKTTDLRGSPSPMDSEMDIREGTTGKYLKEKFSEKDSRRAERVGENQRSKRTGWTPVKEVSKEGSVQENTPAAFHTSTLWPFLNHFTPANTLSTKFPSMKTFGTLTWPQTSKHPSINVE